MIAYPSIGFAFDAQRTYHLFDKLDGSNLRVEWSAKRGFHKFGTRTQLLSDEQPVFKPAPEVFLRRVGEALEPRLRQRKWERVTVFFEYLGPQSFAGSHVDAPEVMEARLIDVAPHNQGFLTPGDFVRLSDGLPSAALLLQGRVTAEVAEAVREGTLPGLGREGVVGKVSEPKRGDALQFFKIKRRSWLERLRAHCGDDTAAFERLR